MSIMFTPLERLIHLYSNGVTNSIVFFFDIRLISLEHVTYDKIHIFLRGEVKYAQLDK